MLEKIRGKCIYHSRGIICIYIYIDHNTEKHTQSTVEGKKGGIKYLDGLSELILGNEPAQMAFRGREEEIDGHHVIEEV